MSDGGKSVDCIYVAACSLDARFTRICVASIRYFYPHVSIKILAGDRLEKSLVRELQRHWNVGLADLPIGNYGWGMVKLEPLFGRSGERFLVLDSDTVVVGDVLATWRESSAAFLVGDDQESEADTHRLYYDWRKIAKIYPATRSPQFIFNSGQWFGTGGVLSRDDFASLIDFSSLPRRLRYPKLFMPGEQGVLNYILNQKAMLDGLVVERRKIMHWPGRGMDGLNSRTIAEKQVPALVIHWAGMKKPKLSGMVGRDVLMFFENLYYQHLPRPRLQRILGIGRHAWVEAQTRLKIRTRMLRRAMEFDAR
jgi:hypothetical protein